MPLTQSHPSLAPPLPQRRSLLSGTAATRVSVLRAAVPLNFVLAQAWPTQAVTLVAPFPACGDANAVARRLFAVMTQNAGEPSATHIKNGRIKASAVASAVASDKRAPGLPDLPSNTEAGVPSDQVANGYGLWAAKGTPPAALAAMQAEMKKTLAGDALKTRWSGLGANPPNLRGPDFGQFVGREIKRWADGVKNSGAKLD